ncbi:hypothetical protein ANCDUO_26296, partial [Ancylostoma duodenale]
MSAMEYDKEETDAQTSSKISGTTRISRVSDTSLYGRATKTNASDEEKFLELQDLSDT